MEKSPTATPPTANSPTATAPTATPPAAIAPSAKMPKDRHAIAKIPTGENAERQKSCGDESHRYESRRHVADGDDALGAAQSGADVYVHERQSQKGTLALIFVMKAAAEKRISVPRLSIGFRILSAQQKIDAHVIEGGDRHQFFGFGITRVRLPFGNRLPRNAEAVRQFFLR